MFAQMEQRLQEMHPKEEDRMFNMHSNQVVHTPMNAVVAMSKRYYRCHPELLERTSLTVRQIHYIREWVEK